MYNFLIQCTPPQENNNIFIFIHGFGSSSCLNEFEASSPFLIKQILKHNSKSGIISFDFVGHGNSKILDKNNFTIITPEEHIKNLKKVFSYANDNFPHSKILPICASHGALIFSLFMDKYPQYQNNIEKIICWYPCLQYENIFYKKHTHTILPLIPGNEELSKKMNTDFSKNISIFNPWGNFFISKQFYKNLIFFKIHQLKHYLFTEQRILLFQFHIVKKLLQ